VFSSALGWLHAEITKESFRGGGSAKSAKSWLLTKEWFTGGGFRESAQSNGWIAKTLLFEKTCERGKAARRRELFEPIWHMVSCRSSIKVLGRQGQSAYFSRVNFRDLGTGLGPLP